MWTESHHLFVPTTPSPETAWHDNFFILGIDSEVTRSRIPLNRAEMFLSQNGLLKGASSFCQPCQWKTCGLTPPPPPPPRELLCSDFIPVPHLIKHRIHESDSNSGKEKNIFRIILEKGDMSEPLLEPRYQNTRKEERDRERERMWIFFHLPFCETICNSLLTNQFERKLRWWAFGCHGNYSAVCSHLMHL